VAVPSWAGGTANGHRGAARTAATAGTGQATGGATGASGPDRRGVLVTAAWAVVIGGGAGWIGKMIGTRRSVAASRAAVRLPVPRSPARRLAAGTDLRLPGLSPFRTPNGSFYRIDISLVTPQVSAEGWSLKVHGMVERELTLTYKELLRRDMIERDVTLACVSNEVGGNLISSAKWLGAPLAELLREAGVKPGADQIISRGHDGITIGTPTQVVMDGRDAMLAVGMNGEPLPQAHGFPVRMVVPGLYGYVSATKWVTDLELGRFSDYDAYWVQRGWAQQAEIKTESRIDTPRNFEQVRAGKVPVAGIAWAQHRGIAKVEVRVDDGPWQQARLAPTPTTDTWRQWVLMWDAAVGEHRLAVRATDRDGNTQTPARAQPFPSGATGWDTTSVRVV
jgi:DMSO/TMAO reductase YedYZ molybdopterin-dependent catalytic subunit